MTWTEIKLVHNSGVDVSSLHKNPLRDERVGWTS
jgi:hypothetical protein